MRVGFLIPGLIIFVVAAAVYMQSGHGTAPYDAVSFLISDKIEKYTGKNTFRVVRIIYDLVATCIGFAAGGEVGIMTVCMVIMMGPTVDYVGKIFDRKKIRWKMQMADTFENKKDKATLKAEKRAAIKAARDAAKSGRKRSKSSVCRRKNIQFSGFSDGSCRLR